MEINYTLLKPTQLFLTQRAWRPRNWNRAPNVLPTKLSSLSHKAIRLGGPFSLQRKRPQIHHHPWIPYRISQSNNESYKPPIVIIMPSLVVSLVRCERQAK